MGVLISYFRSYITNFMIRFTSVMFAAGYGIGIVPGFIGGAFYTYNRYVKIPANWEELLAIEEEKERNRSQKQHRQAVRYRRARAE